MKQETIIQFVCFQTNINLDVFTPAWEEYNKSVGKSNEVNLQEQYNFKNKFRYVSRHTVLKNDFHFVFVKGRKPEHFNDCNVRVIQAGGYLPLQIENKNESESTMTKVIAFLSPDETDITPYKDLSYTYLNIYQAYYESSTYSYILEYYLNNADVAGIVDHLKNESIGAEIGVYKDCSLVGV